MRSLPSVPSSAARPTTSRWYRTIPPVPSLEVQLDTGIPVANGILTCEDDDQALARMQVKGADCAQAPSRWPTCCVC